MYVSHACPSKYGKEPIIVFNTQCGEIQTKKLKSSIHLILRVGFAVPVTFTSSASSSFFYKNGEKGSL